LLRHLSVACGLLLAACGGNGFDNASPGSTDLTGLPASQLRCKLDQPDGTCLSYPANGPVSIPHADVPGCGAGATLIKATDDNCARKMICVD
jgi:hypothetical protein